jgi:tRNA-dihydrouridine synthase B
MDLREPWMLGTLRVPNRVILAPLAGIGNWFVRLQAKRYGAGMAVSEMVSSHAIHHRNEKTCKEMLRIDPRERDGGPVAIQLFGEDPDTMRSAAAYVVAAGADAIDINMGCPVPKVRKTGAGAELLADPDRAVAVARATVDGAAQAASRAGSAPVPVTVKLRSGLRSGESSGFELAHRLVGEAGVAAIGFHPRSAAVHHKGHPDYALAARLVQTLPAPVILTGGLEDPQSIADALSQTGAAAVMLARGALGNPWLFSQLLGRSGGEPTPHDVRRELDWTIERAVEHLGEPRATRYLRKFYPWYVPRLGLAAAEAKRLQEALQTADTLIAVKELLALEPRPLAPAV